MQKVQVRLTVALLFSALAVLAFFGTTVISGPIDFLYRDAAGLTTARSAAQIIALLAVLVLFVSGLLIAIPTALQPGNWLRKALYVLPIYLLGFTLVAIVSTQMLGVGVLGNFFNLQGVGQITLATAWLAVGAVVSVIALVIAAARAKLSVATLRSAVLTTSVASGLSVLAAVAMLVSVALVATSTPASFGGGGFPPGGDGASGQNQTRDRGGAVAPQSTAEAPAGFVPSQAQSTAEAPGGFVPSQAQSTAEASQSGAPNGQFPQGRGEGRGDGRPDGGGFPGGPGGGSGNVVANYEIGGALMALFAVIGAGSAIVALRASRSTATVSNQPSLGLNIPREAGMAVLSGVGVTVIVVVLMQFVPVTRTNPPVQSTLNWDSAQTEDLATRTCMNCHSNETVWPWYASVAPSSWLTVLHVNNARQQLNFSELNSLPAFRKSMLAEEIAMQIRSGAMPPKDYLLLHPEANLTDAEKEQLITGFQASLAGS